MTAKDVPARYRWAAIPHLMVAGAGRAMSFYAEAFGARSLFAVTAPDGSVLHAEMTVEGSVFMVGDAAPPFAAPVGTGTTVGLHLYVDGVDDLAERARKAGAEILQEPTDMFYGDRSAVLRDPFGHVWVFLTHQEDLSPDEIVARGHALLAAADAAEVSARRRAGRPR